MSVHHFICVMAAGENLSILSFGIRSGHWCPKDNVALKGFNQVCKQQGTETQMEELRTSNPPLWKSTVISYRDCKRTSPRVRFDTLRHLDQIRKEFAEDDETLFKKMFFSEYVKHHMMLPAPFTLTESQAVAAWHKDLKDPTKRKSEKSMYNPQSKKIEKFTRIHVEVEENERFRESKVKLGFSLQSLREPLYPWIFWTLQRNNNLLTSLGHYFLQYHYTSLLNILEWSCVSSSSVHLGSGPCEMTIGCNLEQFGSLRRAQVLEKESSSKNPTAGQKKENQGYKEASVYYSSHHQPMTLSYF